MPSDYSVKEPTSPVLSDFCQRTPINWSQHSESMSGVIITIFSGTKNLQRTEEKFSLGVYDSWYMESLASRSLHSLSWWWISVSRDVGFLDNLHLFPIMLSKNVWLLNRYMPVMLKTYIYKTASMIQIKVMKYDNLYL